MMKIRLLMRRMMMLMRMMRMMMKMRMMRRVDIRSCQCKIGFGGCIEFTQLAKTLNA